MRYSYEYKKMCVELYRQGKWVETPEGVKEKNFRNMIQIWARTEESCGVEALRHKNQNKVWTAEEKYELVAKVLAGESNRTTAIAAGIDKGVKVQYIGNTKAKKREPRCGKIEALTAIKHRRVLHGNGNTGSVLSSTGFEPCSKARSHSRSDPVPHEPKNGTQVEKTVRWDRGKPTGSAAYAPSFSTPADSR